MSREAEADEAGDGRAERPAAVLLSLMWLASPALPVGGFSYSEGLEPAVEARLVATEADATRWLLDQLDLALARSDLPLMLLALDAWRRDDLGRAAVLNDRVRRLRESAESRRQTEQTGRSLVEWLRNGGAAGTGPHGVDARVEALAAFAPAPTWPVAFALAAVLGDAAPRDAALAYDFGWAENMAQAAMKAVPLGQSAAQRLLGRLAAGLPAAVAEARARAAAAAGAGIEAAESPARPLAPEPAPSAAADAAAREPQAYAPMWAILSSQHESQYSRLFRS